MMDIIVIPRLERAFSVAMIVAATVASRLELGSSRNNAVGAAANSMLILTVFFCQLEITDAAVLLTNES
jgi:hypothetical protein